jgi:hypothetical protein
VRSQHSEMTKADAEALWKLLGSPEWKLFEIAEVIQAAEERGRRAGIEEAALAPDEAVKRLTAAMREADRLFEQVGGSTRHHVRDCLLPILEKHGLLLIDALAPRDSGKGTDHG